MARFLLALDAIDDPLGRRRRRQRMREEFNYLRIPDSEFVNSYRLNKTLFEELCQAVVPLLPKNRTCIGVDPRIKVITALNFYARGSYQGSVGNNADAPLAQQTVSRCIREVTNALNNPRIVTKYIRFPQSREERTSIKSRFYEKYGLPGVLGCIDCTHIALVRPRENEERFYNRKSYHSLNVQVICDIDNFILNVDASYGGATHDSFIWGESEIKIHLENLVTQGETAYLIGDSGYPLREYLITPFGEVANETPEGQFNKIQKKARSTIERTFGILKGRFLCLLSARELQYCPERAGKITIACCVLHNLCLQGAVDYPPLTDAERQQEQALQPINVHATTTALARRRGEAVRASLVRQLARC